MPPGKVVGLRYVHLTVNVVIEKEPGVGTRRHCPILDCARECVNQILCILKNHIVENDMYTTNK